MAITAPEASDTAVRAYTDRAALACARRVMPLVGAAVIGVFLANLSVFATFLVFNFILHWGS